MPPRPLLLLTALGGLLAGCETDADVPAPAHTPRASVLYLLRQEPTRDTLYSRVEGWLYVGGSQAVFNQQAELGRADASVRVVDQGGAMVEEFRPVTATNSNFYNGPGYYRPQRQQTVRPGQTYTLRATVPGLPPVAGTLTMPLPTVITSASLVRRPPGLDDTVPARLSVTIQDNPATTDYYFATARLVDAQGQPGPWFPVDLDAASQDNTLTVDRLQLSRAFTDDGSIYPYADTNVNGQQFTFTSNVVYNPNYCLTPSGLCPTAAFLEVTVSTLTRDAYRFLLAKRRYIDSLGNPFSEPIPMFSNIEDGFGIFGGASETRYLVPLP